MASTVDLFFWQLNCLTDNVLNLIKNFKHFSMKFSKFNENRKERNYSIIATQKSIASL